jgi:2-polyprenyl-6-methoxyphenol hydroxylase-like FAD-dependent oxidoreductase
MAQSVTKVLIAGAGPTGLLVALGLARANVEVLVIDAAAQISHSPRALTYTPVVLEVLNTFGVLDAARAVALQCGRVEWEFVDNGHVLEVDVSALGELSPFPFNLHMGQDVLAKLILTELERYSCASVRWNARLDSFRQDASGVVAQVDGLQGPETIPADWLIGADGARSTVRRMTGMEFEGFTWPDRYMATNINYDFAKRGYAPARFIIDPVNWALVARVDRGPLWRVTYGESAELPEETAVNRARGRLEHFTGTPDFEIVHAAPYRVHERAAECFRDGRVFLAGDAAHIVNPLGGQGLVAGILDARMLVDSLAGVIQGRYPDDALDHYATERKLMVTRAIRSSAAAMKRPSGRPWMIEP